MRGNNQADFGGSNEIFYFCHADVLRNLRSCLFVERYWHNTKTKQIYLYILKYEYPKNNLPNL